MPNLVITGSDGKRSTRRLEAGQSLTVGRSSRNELVLSDLSLSRHHADLRSVDGEWVLEDAGSRNGTFLNGRRIEEATRLTPGDRISLGSCHVEFRAERESSGRVVFSDQPMASEGTVVIPLNDVMTMPDSAPEVAARESERNENLQARMRKFQVIEQANMELLAHEPMDILLPKVLDLVSRAVNPDRAALLLKEQDGSLECHAFRGDGAEQDMAISRTILNAVMEQKVAILTSDAQVDSRFREGVSIMSQGIHSVMAVPLWNNKEVIGLIYADSRLASGLFQDEDLRVATMLANIAAIQIENARLFEEQLEKQRFEQEARAAADIQRRLLPAGSPDIPGYVVEGFNAPCYEVGGDYYDYLPTRGTRSGIVLADVAGKGMGAAMLMAGLQASIHARLEGDPEPDDLIQHVNSAVSRVAPDNRFVTLFFMEVDHAAHSIRYVNAGHAPEPLLVRANGETETLRSGGVPLGIMPDVTYPIDHVEMRPGDYIFLCSDGVTETMDGDGNEFGEDRLNSLLISKAGEPPPVVRRAVEESLEAHAAGAPQPDDLTLVIIQRQP
jgi:serine phosphatase RsbU (regulator of sigma subunit)/pSer/pThr/pTyr-binding forkhead associated (FHA) protein